MARRRKQSRKVDLRKAYEMGGYTGEYSWFVRNKAIPVIGEASLHSLPSRRGSRVREYSVTERNFHRVVKALGIENTRYKQVQAVKKAVAKAGPAAAAEIIMNLVEQTEQPEASSEYPIRYRIPLHPISHNMLYEAKRNRLVKTKRYKDWRLEFFPLIQRIVPKTGHEVDFMKPVEVDIHFGHRETSRGGGKFDMQNFAKSTIDCSFEHFGFDDSKVCKVNLSREFVSEYTDGFMEVSIRNA